jgi:hypothetical protein
VRMPTLRQMETLNMDRVAPIFIRIYKEENTLEVWKQNRTGWVCSAQILPDLQIFRKTWAEDYPSCHIVLTSEHQVYYVLMYEDYTDTR